MTNDNSELHNLNNINNKNVYNLDNFYEKCNLTFLYDKAKIGDIDAFTQLVNHCIINIKNNKYDTIFTACEAQYIYKNSRYYNKEIWIKMINILFDNEHIFEKIKSTDELMLFFNNATN